MSEYGKSGQTRRYRIDANGRKSLIPDDYFGGWYLSTSPNTGLKWAVYVAPIQERRFRESLWEVATTYLEWFEDIFDKHSQQDRKAWSHKGAIGHRDLGNHVYSAVIQAAFRIRTDQSMSFLDYKQGKTRRHERNNAGHYLDERAQPVLQRTNGSPNTFGGGVPWC